MPQEPSTNTASFAEHLKFQEKLTFADALWTNCSQFIDNNWNQDTTQFQITTYKALHERRNKTASFAEQLKFQDEITSTYGVPVKNKKLR